MNEPTAENGASVGASWRPAQPAEVVAWECTPAEGDEMSCTRRLADGGFLYAKPYGFWEYDPPDGVDAADGQNTEDATFVGAIKAADAFAAAQGLVGAPCRCDACGQEVTA